MNIKKTCLIVLCLITLFVLMGCEDDDGAFVAADSCMRTCVDDYTGEEYGIAIRALAWYHGKNDAYGDKTCYAYVDAFRGKIDSETGQFIDGYVYTGEQVVNKLSPSYRMSFLDSSFEAVPLDNSIVYQLLYAGSFNLVPEESALSLQYQHNIDTCVAEKYLDVYVMCDKDYAKVLCSSDEGTLEITESDDENIYECASQSGECEDFINPNDMHENLKTVLGLAELI
jgi:hypothetical protein